MDRFCFNEDLGKQKRPVSGLFCHLVAKKPIFLQVLTFHHFCKFWESEWYNRDYKAPRAPVYGDGPFVFALLTKGFLKSYYARCRTGTPFFRVAGSTSALLVAARMLPERTATHLKL